MAIGFDEYKEIVKDLKTSRKTCYENRAYLESEKFIAYILSEKDKDNRELLRLRVKTSDRYFLNDEMINVLSLAIDYIKQEKDADQIFDNYITEYGNLVKTYKEISEDSDFKYLTNVYLNNLDKNTNTL